MAPIGYSFNANKPVYRSKERSESKRIFIIFILVSACFAAILYFLFGYEREEGKPEGTEKQYISLAPKPENVSKVSPSVPAPVPARAAEKAAAAVKQQAEKPVPAPVEAKPAAAALSFPEAEKNLAEAEAAYAKGEYSKVRECCYRIFASRKIPDEHPLWQKTADILGKANIKILFTDYPFPEKKAAYSVQPNDGLRKIAMTYNVSSEAVQRSNNMKLTDFNVQLGKTYNIYAGDWQIVISKSRKQLYLFDGGKIFKVYNIGVGKDNRTPAGIFKTGGKRKNPDWYSPKGKIPFGEKGNVLGTRWIRLVPDGKTSRPVSGLGIHGTWEPDSIGKAESNGCVRLLNEDVEELFAIIPDEGKSVSVKIIE
ncbi:MAG: L,D-transpeptidase family protein [Victivallaceae bacterium]|nr:L,D-transpeptidase family protein [Victivallaceae bacterium]